MLSNCCDDTCYYVREKFDRANETPVKAPWEKLLPPPAVPNTWNLRNKFLDAIDNGTYRYNVPFPGGATDARHASVRFMLTASGTAEILLAITPDAFAGQPYDWFSAHVVKNDSGCAYLGSIAFYHGLGYGGGPGPGITNFVNTPGLTLNEWHRLEGCLIQNPGSYGYDATNLMIAKLTCANGKVYSCQELSATGQTIGAYGGLKYSRGSIGTCQFDDYEETYYRNSPTGYNRTCPWCRTPCLISTALSDPSDTEPCLWDDISGSKVIADGKMTITANGSHIQHSIFHPGLKFTGRNTFEFMDNGNEIVAYGTVGNATLTYGSGTYTLVLRDSDGNVLDTATTHGSNDPLRKLNGVICYSNGIFYCTIGGGIYLCVESSLTASGSKYWVGLGGNLGAEFTSFRFDKTYETTDPTDKDCDPCVPCFATCNICLNDASPELLKAVVPPMTDNACSRCDELGGTYILSLDNPLSSSFGCHWAGAGNTACSGISTVPFGTASLAVVLHQIGEPSGWPGSDLTGYRITAHWQFGYEIYWEKNYGLNKPDCAHFLDEELPFVYNGSNICTVTDPLKITSV